MQFWNKALEELSRLHLVIVRWTKFYIKMQMKKEQNVCKKLSIEAPVI